MTGDPKKKILITAFEPFYDEINITEEVIKKIGYNSKECEVKFVVLPVTNDRMQEVEKFFEATDEFQPDFIISLGEDNNSSVADVNYEAVVSQPNSVKLGGEAKLPSFFDQVTLKKLKSFSKKSGLTYTETENEDGGSCNVIHYCSALYMQKRGGDYKDNFIFLHLNDYITPAAVYQRLGDILSQEIPYKKTIDNYNNLKRMFYEQKALENPLEDYYADEVPIVNIKCLDDELNYEFLQLKSKVDALLEQASSKAVEVTKQDADFQVMIDSYASIITNLIPSILNSIKDEKPDQYFIPTAISNFVERDKGNPTPLSKQ